MIVWTRVRERSRFRPDFTISENLEIRNPYSTVLPSKIPGSTVLPSPRGEEKEKEQEEFSPNRLTDRTTFLLPRLSRPIDLSRATSHARHVTHDTSRDANAELECEQFPVGGPHASVSHPQPPISLGALVGSVLDFISDFPSNFPSRRSDSMTSSICPSAPQGIFG